MFAHSVMYTIIIITKQYNYYYAVTMTETINLYLGNNNCTCVELDCQRGLSFAISNPDPNQVDIICPVYASTCYSPERCSRFNGIPFFSICETFEHPDSDCKLRMCFGNVSEILNNSRLDFFLSEKVICRNLGTIYFARRYIRSFEIKGDSQHRNYHSHV